MDYGDGCGPMYPVFINPAPAYQLASLLYGYAFGLMTVIPIAALWRWLRG